MALDKLLFASHNEGKIKEFKTLVHGYKVRIFVPGEVVVTEVQETGKTFKENAFIKAMSAAKETGIPALADDSGFCINALNGAPGVYSARLYDVKEKGYRQAFDRIAKVLFEKKDISCYFECVLALAFPDKKPKFYEGRIDGKFVYPPRGSGGFGYDPVFIPNGHDKTFAEMDEATKNKISHRGVAFKKFILDAL